MSEITIEHLQKNFSSTVAVSDLSITIEKGELVSLLGPSGCGKTTLLRMVAGFETPTSGKIMLRDKNLVDIPPQKRNIGIVFQDYAIFPTMNVFNNVAYGLKIKKYDKETINSLVAEYLELVGLTGYEKRMPSQLSGGQQQRVALARALVIKPDVLLLDEPLSNLDAALRLNIRKEIRKIQQTLGITTIFVTHDQEEALSISDKVFVMRQGELMQGGTPEVIYRRPNNDFVASFIGKSNILYGKVADRNDDIVSIHVDNEVFHVKSDEAITKGTDVWMSLRPQYIRLNEDTADQFDNTLEGTINYIEYLGGLVKGEILLSNGITLEFEHPIRGNAAPDLKKGQAVKGIFSPKDLVIGRNIRKLN
ncbi:ABC transporter ATP-binding protein [Pleomorphochaeta sp. DL1XJH-081]|uniref:ABC transporter ATP-binding protein n=1 Tax=Pleomorphochaeta sp. DL1XJH-081 TaxID=3409690 RepID=UPI003BB597B1